MHNKFIRKQEQQGEGNRRRLSGGGHCAGARAPGRGASVTVRGCAEMLGKKCTENSGKSQRIHFLQNKIVSGFPLKMDTMNSQRICK